MADKRAARIREKNKPLEDRFVAAREFVLPVPSEDVKKQLTDQMFAEVRSMLGEERWPLVQTRITKEREGGGPSNLLGILTDSEQYGLTAHVETDTNGTLKVFCGFSGLLAGHNNGELSMFLPEGNPNRTKGSENFADGIPSQALRERVMAWLQEQAMARLGKGGQP